MVARRTVEQVRTFYKEELVELLKAAIEAYEKESRKLKALGRELIQEYRETHPEQYLMVDGLYVRAGDQIQHNPCSRENKRKGYPGRRR